MMNLFSTFDSFLYFPPFLFMFPLLSSMMSDAMVVSSKSSANKGLKISLSKYLATLDKDHSKSLNFYLLCVFMLLVLFNFFSIFSYIFSMTSSLGPVLMAGSMFWGSYFTVSWVKNLKGSLAHLIPEGCPLGLSWFLMAIEMISALIRPVTLSVRLVANILAGHLIMSLVCKAVEESISVFPIFLSLTLFEFFVSVIQAYIFMTMIKLYQQ